MPVIHSPVRSARRARLLDVPRRHGDVRDVDVRRRRLRGRQRRPSDLSVDSKERKSTYAAAEAGLGYYLKHLRSRTPTSGRSATPAAAPNAAENSPVNQQWDGVGSRHAPLAQDPGLAAEYTIELLHTPSYTKCETDQEAGLDDRHVQRHVQGPRHGPRDRGRTSSQAQHRSPPSSASGFLNFVYFTDQENRDPQADVHASPTRTAQQANCANKYRTAREGNGLRGDPVRRPATRSTARCTPTTRTC